MAIGFSLARKIFSQSTLLRNSVPSDRSQPKPLFPPRPSGTPTRCTILIFLPYSLRSGASAPIAPRNALNAPARPAPDGGPSIFEILAFSAAAGFDEILRFGAGRFGVCGPMPERANPSRIAMCESHGAA